MALSDTPEISKRIAYHERGCTLGRWAKTLPEADRAVLVAWLSDPDVSHTAIVDRINGDDDYDYRVTLHTMGRHRRGDCRCGSL